MAIWDEMIECIEAAQAYEKAHGFGPSPVDISHVVDANRSDRERMQKWSDKDKERFWENGEASIIDARMDIRQTSLRIVAAQMAGQLTVQRQAESLFHVERA